MQPIPEHFRLDFKPVAAREAIVRLGNARFTVLTERLIRLEYDAEGCFEDRASQTFWYRQQPVPPFNFSLTESSLDIETPFLHLHYE
ncbi:MAG: alpha-xylosidase, partial [Anaerolineae bacterium]|nr:alpha-xylosidase [Anaerolineae bacterium]